MQRRPDAPSKSYFSDLTTRNSQHDGDDTVLSHAAIALYVEHHVPQNDRWFVLGGSEDLRALLSKVEMSDDNNELFILIRPYIHSMGLYLRYESGQIKAFIFDSQNWGTRYYPTRLIIEAIQKHYPAADILLSGTELQHQHPAADILLSGMELQHQHNQRGCIQYALTFLEWAASMDNDSALRNGERLFTSYAVNKQPLDGYPHVFQQANNQFPATLLDCGMSHDPHWYERKRQEQIEAVNKSLKEAYLRNDGTLYWEKIVKIVEKRQGVGLSFIRPPMQSTMYDIKLDKNKLTITFKTKDMILYGNLLQFSRAIYPRSVTVQNSQWLLQSDKMTAHYDPATLTLTYTYQSIKTLQAVVEALQQPANAEVLYWNNMRQLLGLEELCKEIMLKIELRKIMQNESGGFYQGTTLSALAALFEAEKMVYVPSREVLVGENASLSIEGLLSQGYTFIAFPLQANNEHQLAVWVDIKKKQVKIINSLSRNQLSEQRLSYLESLLGISRSEFTYQNPVEIQGDDWSCGVHTVRNLLVAYGCETAFPTLAERTECYLRAAHYYDRKAQEQYRINQANEQSLRQLLLLVESFRHQQGNFKSGSVSNNNDTFKVLADYLQKIVWGNTDRQATPENNTGRKNEGQSLLLTQSLRDVSAQYDKGHKADKYGQFILKLASILVENGENLNDMLPAVLEKMSIVKPIGMDEKLYARENKKYKDALDLLTSEVAMSCKGKPPVYLFNLARACFQASQSITDNSKFLNAFLLIVTENKEQADSYHKYIGPLIGSNMDSYLYDFLAFLANQYPALNESQKNTLKSHQAERRAFFEKTERDKKEISDLLEQAGVAYEMKDSDIPKIRNHLPRLQEMIKKGCLVNYTNDEMVYFLDKLISLKSDTSDIEKLFTLYLGKNTDAWEALMIEAINNMRPSDIADTKVDGKSILSCAEECGLTLVINIIILKYGSRFLFAAIESENLHELEVLIKYKINVNAFDWDLLASDSPMMKAVAYGDAAAVELLLAAGANPNAVSDFKGSALMSAATLRYAYIVKMLIAAGANIDAINSDGNTALILAARKGDWDIVEYLLVAGADQHIANRYNETPLLSAAAGGHVHIVKMLIAAGANIDAINSDGNTALILAAINRHSLMVNNLIAAGANIRVANMSGNTVLWFATEYCDISTIKALLERMLLDAFGMVIEVEADILPIRSQRLILLSKIINHGCLKDFNSDDIKAFLASLANLKPEMRETDVLFILFPGKNNREWESLIMKTIKTTYNISMVDLTYARKFKFQLFHDYIIKTTGLYLLRDAIHSKKLADIQSLLLEDIDINAPFFKWGNCDTLLIEVVRDRNMPVIELLLAAGANPGISNKCGETALTYACRYEDTHIAKMLLDRMLSDVFGVAVEVEAANAIDIHHHLPFIQQLIKHGCLSDYTEHDIMCLLDKLANIRPYTERIAKLLLLYSGKNADAWEALMILMIENLTPDVISGIKVNYISILAYAEKHKLKLLVDATLKNIADHEIAVSIIVNDLLNFERYIQYRPICDANIVLAASLLCMNGRHPVFIEMMLASGFNINGADVTGFTALHEAVFYCNTTLLNFLLSVPGINVDAVDREGSNPLALAIHKNNITFVKSLLEAGANPHIVLPLGETVFAWLMKMGEGDFVNKFCQAKGINHHADEIQTIMQLDTKKIGLAGPCTFWREQGHPERAHNKTSILSRINFF